MYGISSRIKLVKGIKESLVINFNKGQIYQLETTDTEGFEDILKKRFFNKEQIDGDLFSFLFDDNMIYEIDSESQENFIQPIEEFVSSSEIDYLVSVYNASYDFRLLLSLCNQLRIPHLLIETDLDIVEELSSYIKSKDCPESVTVLTSCPDKFKEPKDTRITLKEKKMSNFVSRDAINPSYLLYLESLHYNSYFNKKIFIGEKGEFKNTKESTEVFGHLTDKGFFENIDSTINQPEFRKYWNVKKDNCAVCCDCQFRYSCVDNRIPKEVNNDNWRFDSDCGYNPYLGLWNGEKGFKSVKRSQ